MTEAELRAAWVVEPPRLSGPIFLADYDPGWPAAFDREAERIRSALAARVLRLEHVGSTSVPGLAAKPVIDILLVVEDAADEPAWLDLLLAAGYALVIRESDPPHRVLKGPDTNINLHVHSAGSIEIDRFIAFRDRLRQHPEERAAYERTKRELAARDWEFVQNYADAKGDIVEAIIARAGGPPRDA